MGATSFWTIGKGKNVEEAFYAAQDEAYYWHGHNGYTGTIAEKESYIFFPEKEGQEAKEFAAKLLDDDDHRVCQKWGPCGAVKIEEGTYLFFGWASC